MEEGSKVPPYTPLEPEIWQGRLREFSNLHVVRFRRIFQSVFYFLKFGGKEELCIDETNRLDWKKVKHFFSSDKPGNLYETLAAYEPHGPKEDEYKEYEKLVFIDDNIKDVKDDELQ